MEKRENKINIKKIKSFKAFCGLDDTIISFLEIMGVEKQA